MMNYPSERTLNTGSIASILSPSQDPTNRLVSIQNKRETLSISINVNKRVSKTVRNTKSK